MFYINNENDENGWGKAESLNEAIQIAHKAAIRENQEVNVEYQGYVLRKYFPDGSEEIIMDIPVTRSVAT
jgi:hypothetical protein